MKMKNKKKIQISFLLKIHTTIFLFVGIVALLALTSCAPSEGTDANEPDPTNDPGSLTSADVSAANCADVAAGLNCFISVWDTSILSDSLGNSVTFPLLDSGTYNFWVDWGDDSDVTNITTASAATHIYENSGVYTVHISGTIEGFSFGVKVDFHETRITDISQWGSLSFGATQGKQFSNTYNLVGTATDSPDLSKTVDLTEAFKNAAKFNGVVNEWNVSQVTSMANMFDSANVFNRDISAWNVSSVGSMENMFTNAQAFDQDVGAWDVSNVTNMHSMFSYALAFGTSSFAHTVNDWGTKTGKVTTMDSMFKNAKKFNQPVGSWDVSQVTSMANMFENASAFNQDTKGWVLTSLVTATDFRTGATSLTEDNVHDDIKALETK